MKFLLNFPFLINISFEMDVSVRWLISVDSIDIVIALESEMFYALV